MAPAPERPCPRTPGGWQRRLVILARWWPSRDRGRVDADRRIGFRSLRSDATVADASQNIVDRPQGLDDVLEEELTVRFLAGLFPAVGFSHEYLSEARKRLKFDAPSDLRREKTLRLAFEGFGETETPRNWSRDQARLIIDRLVEYFAKDIRWDQRHTGPIGWEGPDSDA
jgi:hypothetical protein